MINCIDIAKGLCSIRINILWHLNRWVDALTVIKTRAMGSNVSSYNSAMRPVFDVFARGNRIELARDCSTIFWQKVAIHHRDLIERQNLDDDPDRIDIIKIFVMMQYKRFVFTKAEGFGKTG